MWMFPATIHHTEAVFSIVRETYGREHDDPMNVLDVAIWGIFLNAALRAAVHLGQDYEVNLRHSLEQCGTVIPRNWKTDQRTKKKYLV